MSTRTRSNRRHAPQARGLTFLEIVLSIAMLALVGGVITGTVSFFSSSTMLERHRLNAMEVANRVILTKLDQPKWEPASMSRRYTLNGFRYAFNMRVDLVDVAENEDVKTQKAEEADLSARISQMEQITVTVTLDEPMSRFSGMPLATLVRIYDPTRTLGPDRLLEWVTHLLDSQAQANESALKNSGSGSGSGGGWR
nr:hypothetical protein [uncultured bacterium]